MYIGEFQNCCGILIICDIPGELDKLSKAEIEGGIEEVKTHLTLYKRVGAIVASLNAIQIRNGSEKILLGAGFEKVGKLFNHPGHGNDIQMYQYCYYKDKATIEAEYIAKKVAYKRRFANT